MPSKKGKKTTAQVATPAVAPPSAATNTPAGQPPAKKRKKNDPLKPQPAWLFPPDEENPILNPKNKSQEQIQKEIDERLAAIKYLNHKSVTAPVKTAPPSELLQLIGAFFASYGFVSTGRIFSLERNARKKLDGWNDEIGEKKFPKNMPDLVKIFKDWRVDFEGDSDAETSSSGSDSEEDVKMEDAAGDSDDSDDDSSDSEKEATKAGPKTDGVKIRTKLRDESSAPAKKTIKPEKSSSSSSESGSESESDSDDEAPTKTTVTKKKTAESLPEPVKAAAATEDASDSSSSESESDSESDSDDDKKPAAAALKQVKQSILPAPVPTTGSDSSSTFKGNSPAKALSPSVSSDSSSDSSSSSSSESVSGSDSKPKKAAETTKEAKTSTKRKASPAVAAESSGPATQDTTPAAKKVKVQNEPFSRIPKDTVVDPRLSSNKYVSYDYAERAHQDLIVTKGKGFTKEKNKKKRGSYRGGKIDTDGGKAIKFDD